MVGHCTIKVADHSLVGQANGLYLIFSHTHSLMDRVRLLLIVYSYNSTYGVALLLLSET